MALGEVTDSKAVIVAIAEFDDVGRDAFLKKYGFSKARSYFIRSDGRRYDSKATSIRKWGLCQHRSSAAVKPLPSECSENSASRF